MWCIIITVINMSEFFEMVEFRSEIPALYGVFHICFLVLAVFICTFGVWLAKKLSGKRIDKLIFFSGIILAVAEIFKQLFYFWNVGKGAYVWRIFPFQLCSIPMYIYLILIFLREGKLKNILYDFLFYFGTLGGLIVLFNPSTAFTSYPLINVHSCVWHIILTYVGILVAVTGKSGLKIRNYLNAVGLYFLTGIIAFIMNCCFSQVSDYKITLFFIGPNIPQVVLLKDIAESYGWFPATVLCMIAMCLGGLLIFLIGKIIEKAVKKSCE